MTQLSAQSTSSTLTGSVVSNKMQKTIKVCIKRRVKHPKYGKYLERSTHLLVHDEKNECHEGDTVVIRSSRPLSKNKSWQLVKIQTSVAPSTETVRNDEERS